MSTAACRLHGSGLVGEAGGWSLLPSPSDREELGPHEAVFPQFPHFYVFWPGRFVLSKLPIPCRVWQRVSHPAVLGDLRTCAQSIPNPRGSGWFLIRAWTDEGPNMGRGQRGCSGFGGLDAASMHCSGR